MTDLRQAAQQAMENLENLENLMEKSIAALRTALEQQAEPVAVDNTRHAKLMARFTENAEAMKALALPQQQAEPVAQVHPNHLKQSADGNPWCREVLFYSGNHEGDLLNGENYRVKLYTTPPQRKELSASEILNMMPSAIPAEYDGPLMEFARAVEAKLKERNGY